MANDPIALGIFVEEVAAALAFLPHVPDTYVGLKISRKRHLGLGERALIKASGSTRYSIDAQLGGRVRERH